MGSAGLVVEMCVMCLRVSVSPGTHSEREEDTDRRQEQTDRALHHGPAHAAVQGNTSVHTHTFGSGLTLAGITNVNDLK